MTGPAIRLTRQGSDPVVIRFPADADPFAIQERCRQEMFPGVAIRQYEPKPLEKPAKRGRR